MRDDRGFSDVNVVNLILHFKQVVLGSNIVGLLVLTVQDLNAHMFSPVLELKRIIYSRKRRNSKDLYLKHELRKEVVHVSAVDRLD